MSKLIKPLNNDGLYKVDSIDGTLELMKRQIEDSLQFAREWLPNVRQNVPYLFRILKQQVTYIADPKGLEMIQSMQTLLTEGYHGVKGGGDCDCFTVMASACAYVSDIPVQIVLAGNGKHATHVYNQMRQKNGRWVNFDLVAPNLGLTRKYKHIHKISLL